MSPETLPEQANYSGHEQYPDRSLLGRVFAESATKYYFLHLPKNQGSEMYKLVLHAFVSEDLEDQNHALQIAAGMWDEGFRLKHGQDPKLFNPKWAVDYPGTQNDPQKVFDHLLISGRATLENSEKFDDFCIWYKEIEQALA